MRSIYFVVGFVAAAGVACGSKAATPAAEPIGNEAPETGNAAAASGAPAEVTDGALWTCQIEDYDPQPCKFHREQDGWHLTKVLGSQRFEGTTTFTESAFHLVGEFFCPWGDCTAAIDTLFQGDGTSFTGTIESSPVRVWWDANNAAEYGGAGYGGLTGREQ